MNGKKRAILDFRGVRGVRVPWLVNSTHDGVELQSRGGALRALGTIRALALVTARSAAKATARSATRATTAWPARTTWHAGPAWTFQTRRTRFLQDLLLFRRQDLVELGLGFLFEFGDLPQLLRGQIQLLDRKPRNEMVATTRTSGTARTVWATSGRSAGTTASRAALTRPTPAWHRPLTTGATTWASEFRTGISRAAESGPLRAALRPQFVAVEDPVAVLVEFLQRR
jgi:hypothetical protein